MSVTTRPEPVSGHPAGPQRASTGGNRLARWRSNWRLGLVMGLRDARRNRARSVLILLMIGLPVLLLVGGRTVISTSDVDPAEGLAGLLGTSQAKLVQQGSSPMIQDATGTNVFSKDDPGEVTPFPGHDPESSWTADQVARLTGGQAMPVAYGNPPVKVGARWVDTSTMVMSGPDLVRSGLGSLVSGRVAAGPGEVAVTQRGLDRGLPASGSVTVRITGGANVEFQVVGVVEAIDAQLTPVDLVTADTRVRGFSEGFLIERDTPILWPEVQRLNAYGFGVMSRAVIQDPPPRSQLDPALFTVDTSERSNQAFLALVVVGLIAETTLLAGPAFAVSAARRRRSLALAASNGAERKQLRQYVLAQALVLGGVAAVVGAVAGIVGAALLFAVASWAGHQLSYAPFDVAWLTVLGIAVVSIAAAVIAALIPARGTSRLDVAAVLAGRHGAGAVRRSFPIVGAALMLGAGAAMVAVVLKFPAYGRTTVFSYLLAAGTVVVLIGAILLIPALLNWLAWAFARGGLPVRLAVRDSLRQRSRAVPAVAAIMAACAGITVLGISDGSTQAQDERTYVASAVLGRGTIDHYGSANEGQATVAEVRRQHPSWTVLERGQLGASSAFRISDEDPETGPRTVVGIVPSGCSTREVLAPDLGDTGEAPCRLIGTDGSSGGIAVAPLAIADPAVELTPLQLRTLRSGGMLVSIGTLVTDDQISLAVGRSTGNEKDGVELEKSRSVPATSIAREDLSSVLHAGSETGAWVLPETAARLGLSTSPARWEIVSPDGAISVADQQAINQVSDPQSGMYVERGYQRPTDITLMVMFGVAGLLVLAAALIVTALSQSESRGDLATLAALGSTVKLRRQLAGAQAGLVALTGVVLGIIVGLPAGIAVGIVKTSLNPQNPNGASVTPPIIVLPWLGFAVLVVVVPLIAVSVAALGVRRVPTMTRRID